MPSIDQLATPSQEGNSEPLEKLPRGLIPPPELVRARVEQERDKHPPALFARYEQQLLNDWTIGFFFGGLYVEVVYRPTPAGPEVVAVGTEEVIAFKKATPLDELLQKYKTYLGYP